MLAIQLANVSTDSNVVLTSAESSAAQALRASVSALSFTVALV